MSCVVRVLSVGGLCVIMCVSCGKKVRIFEHPAWSSPTSYVCVYLVLLRLGGGRSRTPTPRGRGTAPSPHCGVKLKASQ